MGSNPWTAATLALGPIAPLVAPSVYQAEEANKAKKAGQKQAKEQAEQQQALLAGLRDQQAGKESLSAADATRRSARRRQLSLSTGGQSRADTILTSPLGMVGNQSAGQQNTLLGS